MKQRRDLAMEVKHKSFSLLQNVSFVKCVFKGPFLTAMYCT